MGPTVAAWVSRHASRRESLEVTDLDLRDACSGNADLATSLTPVDAVVVVTPEYNHSFPGPLKGAIDSVREEWHAMPVGFVSYGGISGGLRAVEALRCVFAELHTVTVRETVSFAMAWDAFDGDGEPSPSAGPAAAADRLLDQLEWWAGAVRAGRVVNAYPG